MPTRSPTMSSTTDPGACAVAVSAGGISSAPPTSNAAATSDRPSIRSEEHTSELQSLMRISYAVFCLKKKNITLLSHTPTTTPNTTDTINISSTTHTTQPTQ